jgi:hypothetical protein
MIRNLPKINVRYEFVRVACMDANPTILLVDASSVSGLYLRKNPITSRLQPAKKAISFVFGIAAPDLCRSGFTAACRKDRIAMKDLCTKHVRLEF